MVSKINLSLVEETIFLRELCEKELFKMVCEDENSSELIKALLKKCMVKYKKTLHLL